MIGDASPLNRCLLSLSSQSMCDVLLPHIDAVTGYVQTLLGSTELSEQENALRVYETLLVSFVRSTNYFNSTLP